MTLIDLLNKNVNKVRMKHWRPQVYWYWDGHCMNLAGTEIKHTHLSLVQAMSEEWEEYKDTQEEVLPDNVLPFPSAVR